MKETAGSPSMKGPAAARSVLALVVMGLAAFVLFGTGPVDAVAQVSALQTTNSPSESPSESPSGEPEPTPTETEPSGPGITLLNPSVDLVSQVASGAQGEPETQAIISDKFDGHDELYHVTAVVSEVPRNPKVEAYFIPEGGAEVLAGTMTRVENGDTWELFWDIPPEMEGESGVFEARLYRGTTQIAKDSEDSRIDSTEEAVEMSWPENNGPLGFFKPRAGKWRTVLEGTVSEVGRQPTGGAGVERVDGFYSVSKPGGDMEYKRCAAAETNPPAGPEGSTFREWEMGCELAGKDTPSQVTAIAVIAKDTDNPIPGTGGFLTAESADAHRVLGFAQKPADMSLTITPVKADEPTATYPTADARQAGDGCLEFEISVFDQHDRPVQGANVDVHVKGPSDEVGFGSPSSASRAPDKGDHEAEPLWDCDSPGDRGTANQGEHESPGSDDTKHVESTAGTGLSGGTGAGAGEWRFALFSPNAGRTQITAWVDDRNLRKETDSREADSDTQGDAEASATSEAQWLAGPVVVRLTPRSDTFIAGQCTPITVSVRGGRTPVEGANVDVHATGPSDELDFCEPTNGSDARAPDLGDHEEEDEQEGTHPPEAEGASSTQHTEGQTDDGGSFVIGLQSPVDGDTTLQAWVDGTRGQDNDEPGADEPAANGTYSWASSEDDATVTFLNPSGYGDGAGDNVSTMQDANGFFHILTRVDLPDLVDGVEILLSSDGTSFSKLGDAVRIGESELWQFQWTAQNIDEGSYTLRARIRNTERVDDREINLDNTLNTTEITAPANNATASFVDQKTTVTGVASATAEGVTFYYTNTAARERNDAEQWIECGSVELGTADAPQQFQGECQLAESDQPGSVTGIAAIANTCDPNFGCDAPLGGRSHESGDAHRVFGLDAVPNLAISPARGDAAAGTCQRIVVDVEDQAGGSVEGANVDVHLDGPRGAHFCDVDGGDNRDAPTEGGHTAVSGHPDEGRHQNSNVVHTEGTTGGNGRFVVGIRSSRQGRSGLTAWVDSNDNDDEDGSESTADATFDWTEAGKCTESGTDGDDVIRGTPGNDRICGLGGDDVIEGRGGNDRLLGGGGRDILRGGPGADVLTGGGGVDSIVGNGGSDTGKGGRADDVLSGKGGSDTLRGGGDNDTLRGGSGRDSCFGDSGNDSFSGCERQQR